MSHQGAAQLTVELQYNAAVNGAMQQNHVPTVRALQITNNTDHPLTGLMVSLHNNLNIWPRWQVNLEQLDAGASWHTLDLPLSLNWEVWSALTESQQGSISLAIQQLPNQNIIFESEYPLSLLPLGHWQGINVLPELLAAFVTPNLPAIAHLLKEASLLVAQRTGDPSLNDYQSQDINRVRQMMAAIYNVIQARQITYVTVPPSFEEQGQRVRLPDKVLEQQMGNCLDMSLLYAACLEAAGLYPILVVIKGHAFAGCWLVKDTFTDAAVDDPSMLTKRVAAGIHEIALIEATAMNAGKKIAFEDAEKLALENLANPDNFILAIDVKRARFGGVRPLPVRILHQNDWHWQSTEMPADKQQTGSTLTTLKTGEKLVIGEKLELGRRQIWERKLLDLTLRNSLLNLRVTQHSLQLMDEAFDRQPQLEAWALQAEEPLFIKNLENVQGDERDVILFSVGYGPDKDGKVYMNFGPINREGGWRRLNVAVSRARYEMKVFSSLRAAHLQLARSSGEGVAGLRAFLEYAEKGKVVLQPPPALVWPKDAVGSAIAAIIEAAGYRVNAMVGASGFKVDLAVVNPNKPGFYCLGILLDGPRLAAMPAARDRFVGKVQVLRQLGWAIYRVWLADWWLRKNEITGEILAAIEQALSRADSPEQILETTTEPAEPTLLQVQWQPQPASQPVAWLHSEKYVPCHLPPVKNLLPAQFFDAAHEQLIAGQLRRIITQEAPLVQRLLFQKVLEAWGISRMGNRLHAHMANVLKALEVVVTEIEEQTIIAMPGFDTSTYRSYRLPDAAEGAYRRAADELPVPEVANAITELIGQHISMPTEVVLREAARLFGFARGGTQVDKLMLKAMKYAQQQGRIKEKNGSWIPAS